LFKGDDETAPEWAREPDIGILVSYDEATKEGVMFWLRYPDPEEGRLNQFDFNQIQEEKFERFVYRG
jgi:hypothetical protein